MPANGGAASNQVVSYMFGYGRTSGLPYDEYTTVGLDYAVMWWSPTDTGKGKLILDEGTDASATSTARSGHYAAVEEGRAEAVRREQLDRAVRVALDSDAVADYPCKVPEHDELTTELARPS